MRGRAYTHLNSGHPVASSFNNSLLKTFYEKYQYQDGRGKRDSHKVKNVKVKSTILH